MRYFVLHYFETSCAYWVSKKGYCYCQFEGDEYPRRISYKDYISAYEMYMNY